MGVERFSSSRYSYGELCSWLGKREDWISEVADLALRRGCPLREEWQKRAVEFTLSASRILGPVSVRQVHYHLVAGSVPGYSNTLSDYERLVEFMLRARIAGVVPWSAVSEEESLSYTPRVVRAGAGVSVEGAGGSQGQAVDPWREVGMRVFVFTEKRELFKQLLVVCRRYAVPLVSFKGYGSVWTRLSRLAPRMREWVREEGSRIYILIISDHDPSGLDINRFYLSVLRNYFKVEFEDVRVALTADQIVRYNLPPNPAKETDPRFKWYRRVFGEESWEVDALVVAGLTLLRDTLEESIRGILGSSLERFLSVLEEARGGRKDLIGGADTSPAGGGGGEEVSD